MGKVREFELRFNGLHGQPEVVARTDGQLNNPREVLHVLERFAYDKAVAALKEIYADGSYTDIASEIATRALNELGEL